MTEIPLSFRTKKERFRYWWRTSVFPLVKRYWIPVLVALGVGSLVYWMMAFVPGVWAGGDPELEVEERGNFIAVLAGIFAAFGLLLTRQRNELSRDENRTKRYSEAVRLLGSERLTERLGGIYALQRLAGESSHDAPAIAQLLAAFVRDASNVIVQEHAAIEQTRNPELTHLDGAPEDIVAATRALCQPDLQRYIMGSFFTGVGSLEGAVLMGANLSNLHFNSVDLRGAYLDGARFNSAWMMNAQLSGARGRHVDFQGAKLKDAGMANSDMRYSTFSAADVTNMMVEGSSFDGATIDTSFCNSVIGEWTGSPIVFSWQSLNDQPSNDTGSPT